MANDGAPAFGAPARELYAAALDQVAWADRNSLLHRIQMFFQAMPPSGWTRLKK